MTDIIDNKNKKTSLIQINTQIAKQNLKNLKKELLNSPKRLKSLKFLYTDICKALGIEGSSSSHYGEFIENGFDCSIRVSNHNSNANTYGFNLNNNISIKIKPHTSPNRFIASDTVTLEEFVYYDYMFAQDTQLVYDIIDSLIGYLSTGEYVDKSGVAKKNYSPNMSIISQQRVQQTLQRKDNEDFINRWHIGENKKVVRLTESKLRNIIAESIKRVLIENDSFCTML